MTATPFENLLTDTQKRHQDIGAPPHAPTAQSTDTFDMDGIDPQEVENMRHSVEVLGEPIAHLHAQGKSRNAIAKQMHISTYRVDQIAKHLGLSFSGDAPAAAHRARQQQAQTHRSELAEQLRRIAQQALDDAENPIHSPTDRRQLMVIAGIALDKENALERTIREKETDMQIDDINAGLDDPL